MIAQDPEAVALGLGGIALDVVREIVAAVVEQVDRGREVMNDAAAGGDPEVDLAPMIGGGVAVQGRGRSVGVIVMIVAEEIEIDATVVIANIVIETDMVGLRGMVVAVGLLRGDTTMTGMVLHHPDSTVVVHHLQALVVAFLGVTSPHPIQECEGVGVHRDVMMALLV